MPNRTLIQLLARAVLGLALLAACTSPVENVPIDTIPPIGSGVGSLIIGVTGLIAPGANTVITGPSGYSLTIAAATTLTGLEPGDYHLHSSNVIQRAGIYEPVTSDTSIRIPRLAVARHMVIGYRPAIGSLDVAISGLPPGVLANVLITGPPTFVDTVATRSQHFDRVQAGFYAIQTLVVSQNRITYGDTLALQSILVPASTTATITATTASVQYAALTGQLTVAVDGVPNGLSPKVDVSGPFGDSASVSDTGTTTFTALPLGRYAVTANAVSNGPNTYEPLIALVYATIDPATRRTSASIRYADPSLGTSLTMLITGLPVGSRANVTAFHLCPYSSSSPQYWRCRYLSLSHSFATSGIWFLAGGSQLTISVGDVRRGVTYTGVASARSVNILGADTVRVVYHRAP